MSENENGGYAPEEVKEEPLETREFVQERIDIAGEIQKLVYVSIAAIIINIFNIIPILNIFSSIAAITYGIWAIVVFFRMGKVVSQYKKAAISKIVGAITIVVGGLVDVIGISVAWIVELAGLLILFMAEYNEYEGHRELLIGVDDALSKKWKKLWNWYAASLATTIVGEVVMVLVPEIAFDTIAVFAITAAITIFTVLISIMKLVYLVKMHKAFY